MMMYLVTCHVIYQHQLLSLICPITLYVRQSPEARRVKPEDLRLNSTTCIFQTIF